MDEIPNSAGPPPSSVPSHWIARVLIAILLAEGIWGLIVSLTRDLLVPFLAQQVGGDPQSPLYMGKGAYDFPAVLGAVLELCFAGIVAAGVNAWLNRGPKAPRVRVVKVRKIVTKAASPSVAPAAAGPLSILAAPAPAAAPTPSTPPPLAQPATTPQISPAPVSVPPAPVPSQPKPVPVAAPAKPAKPKPPKEVYYNIVGEPINPTEDED